jgi:hypothetical protein
VYLVDGTKYVVRETFEQLMLNIRDHRATVVVAQKRLAGGVAEFAENAAKVARASVRIERRRYERTPDNPGDPDDRGMHDAPDSDED